MVEIKAAMSQISDLKKAAMIGHKVNSDARGNKQEVTDSNKSDLQHEEELASVGTQSRGVSDLNTERS